MEMKKRMFEINKTRAHVIRVDKVLKNLKGKIKNFQRKEIRPSKFMKKNICNYNIECCVSISYKKNDFSCLFIIDSI